MYISFQEIIIKDITKELREKLKLPINMPVLGRVLFTERRINMEPKRKIWQQLEQLGILLDAVAGTLTVLGAGAANDVDGEDVQYSLDLVVEHMREKIIDPLNNIAEQLKNSEKESKD